MSNHLALRAVADGAGGVIVAWADSTDGVGAVRVQRLDANGATAAGWLASGRSLTDDPSIATAGPVVADRLGGVVVGLQRATGVAQYDLFASHVTAAGALDPIWPAGGLLVIGLSGLLSPPASLVADGHGGALAIWVRRPFSSVAEVRAYRLGADGLPTTEVPRTFAAGAIAVSPNPSAGITRLAFTLAGSGPVRLGVYDVSGRRVRTLESGALPAGGHTRQWDGRDDAGAVMPAGLYLVRASGAGLESTARIVRVK